MLLQHIPVRTNLRFMAFRFPAFILSAVLLVLAVVAITTRGLNLGIDFAGGSVIEVTQPEDVSIADVRGVVDPLELGDVQVNSARGVGANADDIVIIRFETQPGETAADRERAQQDANNAVRDALGTAFPSMEILSSAAVGPKVSGELLQDGLLALGFALVLMLAYIWVRFEWQFSVGAVAALFHDVVLTIGLFSLLQLEFDLSTIAALLTIIGYSMNDTVVVFDRVREEARKYKSMPTGQVIDLALNGTLSRTLLTSGTTLVALLAIFFLGGPVLRGMSFALIWGVLIGTYSSIFIASSILNTVGMDLNKARTEVEGFTGA